MDQDARRLFIGPVSELRRLKIEPDIQRNHYAQLIFEDLTISLSV